MPKKEKLIPHLPLDFKEAVADLLKVKPPEKGKLKKQPKPKKKT